MPRAFCSSLSRLSHSSPHGRACAQGTLQHFNALTDLAVKFKDGAPEPTTEDLALMAARYKGEEPIFHRQSGGQRVGLGGEWVAPAAAL